MTAGQRRLETGIESCAAVLPGPPALWSYSSLREVGACPRRYALSRARYPDLWDGRGYPRLPALPALFGDVVHNAVEKIVKALVAAGCESPQSAQAVSVLRALGGYTAVVELATTARLAALAGNPRLREDLRQRIERGLRDRVADARAQVQAYISTSVMGPLAGQPPGPGKAGGGPSSAQGAAALRGPLSPGAHPEAVLTAGGLRLTGRVDLLRVSEAGADITDYKTGSESSSHQEQLDLYVLLWDLDRDANPSGLPATSLTAAYPGRDVSFPVPDESALREIEKSTAAAIAAANTEVASPVPRAVPSPDNCGRCDVRHLCGEYWCDVAATDPSALPDQASFDCQGMVGARHGEHSWWMYPDGDLGQKLLIQVPLAGPQLPSGDRVRILGLRIDADADTKTTVALMNSATEVFRMTAL